AAEFVRLHRTSLGGKLACRYVAAHRKGSTRTSVYHSSIVGFPNATIITVRQRQPLDGLRPASQTMPPSPIHNAPRCGKELAVYMIPAAVAPAGFRRPCVSAHSPVVQGSCGATNHGEQNRQRASESPRNGALHLYLK